VRPQDDPEEQYREIVLIAFCARQNRTRAEAAIPPSAECQQATADDVADEVLLAHRERSALPPFSDIVEIGHEHLTHHDVQRESGEQAVERALRTDVVIALERASEIVGSLLQAS
jgi:hypothetical protein